MQTSRRRLDDILTQTDCLSVSVDGGLMIEGCRATDLVRRFGSPLYVLSEAVLRTNLRRFKAAFVAAWPAQVEELFAIKANSNVAVRAIANEEGVGSDCNSVGELELTFRGGADPQTVTLNGCNKQPEEIRRALELGVLVILDAEADVDVVEAVAEAVGVQARIGIRLKAVDDDYFEDFQSDAYPQPGGFKDLIRRKKWGVSRGAAIRMINRILASNRLSLEGYHTHLGRMSRGLDLFPVNHRKLAERVVELYRETGFRPRFLDIGGGWPRERDPEARTTVLNSFTIEDYAAETCAAMCDIFEAAGVMLPELWVEPGRYVAGNAGFLLTTIGVIKKDHGMVWINVDASGELMILVQNLGSLNHITVTEDMDRPLRMTADIVAPTCVAGIFAKDCDLPEVCRGEVLAVLDAGAYAESQASQFNSIPRPATVLVNGGDAEVIRRREALDDVFATQVVPERFKSL